MNKLALNIIHRPELSPEYAERALGGRKDVRDESLDIFLFQQQSAHEQGLKTTIQITYASLFSDKIVEIAKEHHDKYGDEIGLSLLGLPCKQFREKYNTEDFCIWMFDEQTKMDIVDDCFSLFYEKFGFYPESTGSYFLDAFTINYIKDKYPSVKCAVATCWEEGPKAYHTCNNSWYTFMDGGPWNPWIPSKVNSHCPASNKSDDSGIVAIPHLSRDLMACFDGNGSNFGTHPQNVLRGMIYYKDGNTVEYPYLYNLIDQYRHLEKYNDGYSYNMVFVGPGWLNRAGRWEAPYELLAKSYVDCMKYYGKLKREGKVLDLTMSEFADFYRERHPDYSRAECALWKDILYGSDKEYFWYADSNMRTCLDFNQGGAMIDLRPYVARLPQNTGIGTDNVYDASYPYLIQINYRAGYFTHYAGAGTIKSCRISYHGQSADLCLCRTMARYEKVTNGVRLIANPVTVTLDGLDIVIQSTFTFEQGSGRVITRREILNDLHGEEITIEEYFTGAFGTTEYQADMTKLTLGVGSEIINYTYHGKKIEKAHNKAPLTAYVVIPDVMTKVEMGGDADKFKVEEGIAFSPVYHLSLTKTLTKGAVETWLRLAKAN
ncbi:MAG: hypothetical protein J1G02_04670 [Clostridiales bacterium]|nr:hypothetical protein [Clostridiales bacterium]